MPLALWALVIGAFGIGTTEFIIAGLLPAIAVDFGVSIPVAARLATSYALGVFVGAPVLIILGSRISKKSMLAYLAGLFVLGNLVTALAPSLEVAVVGRLITSLTHGAFFGIGSVLAAELVPKERRVRAIALMFSGLTVANLVGVPAGTWLGQEFSWQVPFYAITAIGVATAAAVLAFIPTTPKSRAQPIAHEFAAFGDPKVLLAMGITVLGPAAFFTSITYIAPMMTEVAGFSAGSVTWLLMVFGFGLFVGNWLGARYADRALMPMLYGTLLAQAIVLFVFHFVASSQVASVVCIFLMAAFGFATVSPIQKLVMDKAKAAGGPTLASAVNIGLFNLGNALGTWLGGWVIAHGFGFSSPNWAGGLISLGALLLAVASGLLDRHDATGLLLKLIRATRVPFIKLDSVCRRVGPALYRAAKKATAKKAAVKQPAVKQADSEKGRGQEDCCRRAGHQEGARQEGDAGEDGGGEAGQPASGEEGRCGCAIGSSQGACGGRW